MVINSLKFSVVCLVVMFLDQARVEAHPHVFISQRLTVVFNEKGLAGFRVTWVFDDMFSGMIAGDYDRNGDGAFDPAEAALIRKEAFDNIAEHRYFTFVTIDGKPFDVRFIKDFSAAIDEKRILTYTFLIPCHVTAVTGPKQVKIATYDPTYYSALFFAEDRPVSVDNPGALAVSTGIRQDTSTSIYFGQIHPWALFVDFRTP
ncbi:hypothetical protein JCM14469_15470 [Desulfatiferula olefinivorans]